MLWNQSRYTLILKHNKFYKTVRSIDIYNISLSILLPYQNNFGSTCIIDQSSFILSLFAISPVLLNASCV